MGDKVQFTAVYDWLAGRMDLTATEKLIIAHILRYGKSGCYKSNSQMAADLGMGRRQLIRTLGKLQKEEWVAILYQSRRERILYVYEKRLDNMPLFDGVRNCGKPVRKPVKKAVKSSGWGSVILSLPGVILSLPFIRNKKNVSYSNETKEIVAAAALKMKKERGSRQSPAEADRRRRKLLDQMDAMRAAEKETE